jgi:hypothetical protein
MDAHEFNEETGTNILSAPPHTARSVEAPDCNVCENRHAFGTPCVEPFQKGPRTGRVRVAVAISATGMYVAHGDIGQQGYCESFVKKTLAEMGGTRMPWRLATIEADVPLPETPTVEGTVTK